MAARNPWHVRHARGTKIKPEHQRVLDECYDKAGKAGYTVLGSLTARIPGFLTFFATAYRSKWEAEGFEGLPLFGVVKVSILNNGDVTCRVLGTGEGSYEQLPTASIKFTN